MFPLNEVYWGTQHAHVDRMAILNIHKIRGHHTVLTNLQQYRITQNIWDRMSMEFSPNNWTLRIEAFSWTVLKHLETPEVHSKAVPGTIRYCLFNEHCHLNWRIILQSHHNTPSSYEEERLRLDNASNII